MHRSSRGRRVLYLLSVFATICSGLLVYSSSKNVFSQEKDLQIQPTDPTQAAQCDPTPLATHALAATYYSFKKDLNATLMLSNQGPNQMPVQITAFNLAGQRFDFPVVVFAGTEVKVFDLRTYLGHLRDFEEGSLQISFQGKRLALGGVVHLVDPNQGLIFDEELSGLRSFNSSSLETVWWTPLNGTELLLALSNTTDETITTQVFIQGLVPEQEHPRVFSLSAHETKLLGVDDLSDRSVLRIAKTGGISVSHSGPAGGILARGFMQKPTDGYSTVVEFSDVARFKEPKLAGVGLRIAPINGTKLELGIVARNIANHTVKLTGRISSGSGSIHIPEVWLNPREVRQINIKRLLLARNTEGADTAGLQFTHTGKAGDIVMSAASVSRDGGQVFRVPFRDASLASSTGIYPWSLEGDNNALIYLQNVSDVPRNYTLQIVFDGGVYVPGLKKIEAESVASYDLRKLRDEQTPDFAGRVIPRTVTSGKAHWSINGDGDRSIIGRIEQANYASAVSSTSACGACCPNSFDWVEPLPYYVSGFPGDTTQFGALVHQVDCLGNPVPAYPMYGSFTSRDDSVATITWSGFATAVGAGSTFFDFYGTGDIYINCCGECGNEEYCCNQMQVPATCEAECAVRPRITSMSPARAGVGSTTNVTINGSGFRSGATVSAGSGITVSNVTFVSSAKITADFAVAANATGGNRSVSVTVAGQTSNTSNFFVQIPTKARRDELTNIVIREPNPGDFVNIFGVTTRTNVCGAYRNVKYTVVDQSQTPEPILQELMVTEILTDFMPSDPNIPAPQANSTTTNDEGVFGDQIAVAYAPPCNIPPFSYTLKQAFKVIVGQNTYNLTTKNDVSVAKTAPAQWTITLTNTTP